MTTSRGNPAAADPSAGRQAACESYGDRIGCSWGSTQRTPAPPGSPHGPDLGVTYAHVVDADNALRTEPSARGLPITLAVAADGRIVERRVREPSADRLGELASLLAVKGTEP